MTTHAAVVEVIRGSKMGRLWEYCELGRRGSEHHSMSITLKVLAREAPIGYVPCLFMMFTASLWCEPQGY